MAMKPVSIGLALGLGLTVLAVLVFRCLDVIMQMVDPLSTNLGM
jgi:hypothetical protein